MTGGDDSISLLALLNALEPANKHIPTPMPISSFLKVVAAMALETAELVTK